ncbi:MAG: ABC transporter permease [Clostridium celatum]|nr:ABC transporter permease [Clostridium celatum]
MKYLLNDIKSNKIYYLLITFSLIIFSFATSLSITSFIDYYEKKLGSLVGNSKYIYELQLTGATDDDLKNLSTFSQDNFNDINIVSNINIDRGISKIFVFNYTAWNNSLIEGNKFDGDTYTAIVNNNDYHIGDYININSVKYRIIGKLDESTFDFNDYVYIPYDNERDNIGSDIFTVSNQLNLLVYSDRKITTEIDMIKNALVENNNKLSINVINKKLQFFIESFKPSTYFVSRVIYSLLLVLISLINLILFISYFNNSKKKEMYTKMVLGASNFYLLVNEFLKLFICIVLSSAFTLSIQHFLNLLGIKTEEIPMTIYTHNIIFVPIISTILIFIILFFIYPNGNNKNISSILKE